VCSSSTGASKSASFPAANLSKSSRRARRRRTRKSRRVPRLVSAGGMQPAPLPCPAACISSTISATPSAHTCPKKRRVNAFSPVISAINQHERGFMRFAPKILCFFSPRRRCVSLIYARVKAAPDLAFNSQQQ
jgi:hypothetical protein